MALARFVRLHEASETDCSRIGPPRFAVLIARSPAGVALVFNRWREVWELPGGLIDAGESPRDCAVREFREEAGGEAGELEWLGLVEVNDGNTHFGAVYRCTARFMPDAFQSEETTALAFWTPRQAPQPMGQTDSALLNRHG
ncbi:MAG TPA: NUDIX hydrolase [Steroidobacteraceae bacterium]